MSCATPSPHSLGRGGSRALNRGDIALFTNARRLSPAPRNSSAGRTFKPTACRAPLATRSIGPPLPTVHAECTIHLAASAVGHRHPRQCRDFRAVRQNRTETRQAVTLCARDGRHSRQGVPIGRGCRQRLCQLFRALPLPKLASALDSWYRALCAPEGDPSWKGVFDPADQPQQIALTAGFMCAVTCDLHNEPLSSEAMKLLKLLGQASTCAGALPWGHGKPAVVFSAAKTHEELGDDAAAAERGP